MCRWFAYISPTEPCLLEDVLISSEHSLCKQVNDNYLPGLISSHHSITPGEKEAVLRNHYLNVDGFGIAYYNPTRSEYTSIEGEWPVVYKCPRPPLMDRNFRSLAANTSTRTLFAHIRASSAAPVVTVNNHPFVFGRQSIMHNGSIGEFAKTQLRIRERLDFEANASIKGSTDSEHFAALYMTYLRQGAANPVADVVTSWDQTYSANEMKIALQKALETLFEVQISILGEERPGNSINVCVTDGRSMVAMRVRNHEDEEPPSLYYSTTAGVTLNRKYPGTADGEVNSLWSSELRWAREEKQHGTHMICASEPSTKVASQWILIPKNHCVLVEPDGQMRLETMDFHPSLNAPKVTATLQNIASHLNGSKFHGEHGH